MDSFKNDSKWSGSIGGPAWYEAIKFGGVILNNLIDGDCKAALENLNLAIHTQHNTGWTFNKFLPSREMDICAKSPIRTAVKCGPELYSAILASEQGQADLADWFKGRRHIAIDEPKENTIEAEEKNAASELEDRENEDCERVTCDCGNCECGICNPDGDCGDSDCPVCHPAAEEPEPIKGLILTAQVKVDGNVLHVQFKTDQPNESKGYYSKNITPGHLGKAKQIIAESPKVPSLNNGSVEKYVALSKKGVCNCSSCNGTWVLGDTDHYMYVSVN
jgi:hypothetical protein